MTTHTIRKGFDLRLPGAPELVLAQAAEPAFVALHTAEFPGIKPKALVKEGDEVVTGQPLFLDKRDRDIVWCSPTTGRVKTLEFGERRFLLQAVIENGAAGGKEKFAEAIVPSGDRAAVTKAIKNAGLWQLFTQRPVGRMPMSDREPVAIFVNGMDTAPLAADPCFATKGHKAELQAGIDLLKKLTSGKIYLCLRAAGDHQSEARSLAGVEVHDFAGPHPSGLVGTHISCLQPLKPGQIAYALRLQDVLRLGSWVKTGRYPAQTVVAVAGSKAPTCRYLQVRQGAALGALLGDAALGDARIVDGTVLHGTQLDPAGTLGLRTTTLTVMPEGEGQRDLFGWALPQFGKLSFHRSVMSWLVPKKEYDVDARLNGGPRPIVNIGAWERVTPLDIHPAYLVRAIMANDIEEAMKLGLLEVTEEDVALCTFVDPCKVDVGSIVRQGLDLFEKEG